LVARVDETGHVERAVPLWGPEGLLPFCGRLLVACPWSIRSLSFELDDERSFLSQPWCNYLHSMRVTVRGLLVAASGVDALFELGADATLRWQWWATEHGYMESACGGPRHLEPLAEHRGLKYDTPLHSTHVNSALELDDATILATLFHQGELVAINRATGESRRLLGGLKRPHAVRRCPDGTLTLANTGAGEALRLSLVGRERVEVQARVQCDTTWLQDAYFVDERWLLVDGANARVIHADASGRTLRVDQFPPDWRLYEAIPIASAMQHP
jgi:hypothetical protein